MEKMTITGTGKNNKVKVMRIRMILVAALFVVFFGGLFTYFWIDEHENKPIDVNATDITTFTIEAGMTPSMVNAALEDLGLIRSDGMANFIVRLRSWGDIQAGEYAVSTSMSLRDMYAMFSGGLIAEAPSVRVTIPEGEILEFIAGAMSSVVDMPADELLATWQDPEFLRPLIDEYWFLTDEILNPVLYHPLEGYIYPITYEFRDETYTIEELTRTLLDMTALRLEPIRQELENHDWTIHEILSFASVVEAETQDIEQKATVAGVFHNRLDIGMRFESCATVQYIAPERQTHVTYEMIAIVSPFNTYQNPGIPPGSVNSPSIHSIKAAINPANHDYIFFIGDIFNCIDGRTHFFTNFTDHEAFYRDYLAPSYAAGYSVCQ